MRGPLLVVVAGAGIGGLEALLALRALAGPRVATTVIDPATTFSVRAARVGSAFARSDPGTHEVRSIVESQDATLLRGALCAVRRDEQIAVLHDGRELRYDALVVAVGARPSVVYDAAITFGGPHDEDAMTTTLRELEAGRVQDLAFVAPPGVAWTLPLYELALMTAAHAELLGLAPRITLVTPELRALQPFGEAVSEHVAAALTAAGVEHAAGIAVADVSPAGAIVATDGSVIAQADRVVALPRLRGRAIDGLPHDADGFLPADAVGRVPDAPGVHAIGDARAGMPKHGGLAAQGAEAVAHRIAQRAGAPVSAPAPRPVLRAQLMEGMTSRFIRVPLGAGASDAEPTISSEPLWWPPLKVAAPRLARYLAEVRS
jgi:sulfide:quinone oxidoreductase